MRKVLVTVEIVYDPDVWNYEYGQNQSIQEIEEAISERITQDVRHGLCAYQFDTVDLDGFKGEDLEV